MDFSIILVSRKRTKFLKHLLNSLEFTMNTQYEVLVGCDLDDEESKNFALEEKNNKHVKFYFQPRNPNLHTYINLLARDARGVYLFGLNDDCELFLPGWDEKTKNVLDKAGGCCYGVTSDNSIDKVAGGEYAAFPIISKKAVDHLGFFMEESYGNHGSDVVTYRIYKDAGMVHKVPVQIRHLLHESPQMLEVRQRDQTAREMIERTFSQGNLEKIFTCDVSHYVQKLKEYI